MIELQLVLEPARLHAQAPGLDVVALVCEPRTVRVHRIGHAGGGAADAAAVLVRVDALVGVEAVGAPVLPRRIGDVQRVVAGDALGEPQLGVVEVVVDVVDVETHGPRLGWHVGRMQDRLLPVAVGQVVLAQAGRVLPAAGHGAGVARRVAGQEGFGTVVGRAVAVAGSQLQRGLEAVPGIAAQVQRPVGLVGLLALGIGAVDVAVLADQRGIEPVGDAVADVAAEAGLGVAHRRVEAAEAAGDAGVLRQRIAADVHVLVARGLVVAVVVAQPGVPAQAIGRPARQAQVAQGGVDAGIERTARQRLR